MRRHPTGAGGSDRMHVVGVDEADHREVSTNTMKLLLPIRRGVEDLEPVLGIRPNQIGRQIDAAMRSCTMTGSWRSFTTSCGIIVVVGVPRGCWESTAGPLLRAWKGEA